ncbi:hypothetical protein I4U23_017746 [Adineta vaga]|nr:hypothetical protein I4U23_017746 [Adineta vaga]
MAIDQETVENNTVKYNQICSRIVQLLFHVTEFIEYAMLVQSIFQLEQTVQLIDQIDNFKNRLMEKCRNNQVITPADLEKLVENGVTRPLLVAQKEQLRTQRNQRGIDPFH